MVQTKLAPFGPKDKATSYIRNTFIDALATHPVPGMYTTEQETYSV